MTSKIDWNEIWSPDKKITERPLSVEDIQKIIEDHYADVNNNRQG